ncbi:MAG: SigE family RNA polymerase sigma factor [Actinomycetales bacterium]|nr:SigE family RNA polymerase sigma factor [Actinomycetales bacterium]
MHRSSRDEEFSAFVRAHRVDLLRSACLLTAGDVHLAEDLVQTALSRLYVAWPRVRRTGGQSGYVWRTMVNAHVDETRRPRWRRERSVPDPPDRPAAASADHAQETVDGQAVRAALAELAPRMRAVVVLRHWLDLSIEETAEILGCSHGTVKSQSAKAVARLRGLLGDQNPVAGLTREEVHG